MVISDVNKEAPPKRGSWPPVQGAELVFVQPTDQEGQPAAVRHMQQTAGCSATPPLQKRAPDPRPSVHSKREKKQAQQPPIKKNPALWPGY
jgi:hypothetical protein